ncbi:MAG: putative signal transducing protein [Planctomycetota bacterium]|jgi:hypothetical protein
MSTSDAHPVRIFVGKSLMEAELCVSFLESTGIHAYVENEATHEAFGAVELALDEKTGVGVVVSSEHLDAAKAAVEDFTTREPLPDDQTVEMEAVSDDAEAGGADQEE